MILYTPAQPELVFEGALEEDTSPQSVLCDVDGVPVLVSLTGANEGSIQRVLSTDPMVFLDDRLAPGRVISFDSGELK